MTVYFGKMAEWVEMLFGHMGSGKFWRGNGWHSVTYRENTASALQNV